MTDNWFTQAFGAHYPILYQHRNTAEARRCLELLAGLAPFVSDSGRLVLDLGCGDGRHLELLERLGYSSVGLDLSADLLSGARTRLGEGAAIRLVRGDMRCLPFPGSSFASVLSLFTAFGYFGPPAANLVPAREVSRVLEEGGHWFLDYFDGDRLLAELGDGRPRFRERELGPLVVQEERVFVRGESQVAKRVRLTARPGRRSEADQLGVPTEGLEYTEKVAVFTLAELDGMAASQGLFRVAAAGGYDGQPLGQANRWILVYKKSAKEV